MAAPAFKAAGNAGGSIAANVTLANPGAGGSAVANGDILIVVISKDSTTDPTPPSGGSNPTWTLVGSEVSNAYSTHVYWARWATGNTASHVFTFASIWRDAVITSYSGARSGNIIDPTTTIAWTTTASALTLASGSATTTTADVMVLAIHSAVNGGPWTPGSSMTEHADNGEAHIQGIAQVAAGATGTKSATSTSGVAGPMKALLFGIASVAGAAAATSLPPQPMMTPYLGLIGR